MTAMRRFLPGSGGGGCEGAMLREGGVDGMEVVRRIMGDMRCAVANRGQRREKVLVPIIGEGWLRPYVGSRVGGKILEGLQTGGAELWTFFLLAPSLIKLKKLISTQHLYTWEK